MKKLLMVLAVSVFVLSASTVFGLGDAMNVSGEWVVDQCEICGAPTHRYINYYISVGSSYGEWCIYGDQQVDIGYFTHINACQKCAEKYSKELNELIFSTRDNWLQEKIAENKNLREQYESERKAKKIKALEDKISEVQEEIKKLKQEN